MNMSIERKQIQIIKIAQKQLGLDDDTYRALLGNEFGKASCTTLTRAQAERLIGIFKQKGFVIRSKGEAPRTRKSNVPRSGGNAVRMVSQAELDKIAAVAGLIKWRHANGLERWIKKRFGLDRVRTSHDAWRVIEGLKKMFENRMKRDFGKGWWVRVYDDPAIEIYKTEHCPECYILPMMKARYDALQVNACPIGRRAE